jgi:hypothetical protein
MIPCAHRESNNTCKRKWFWKKECVLKNSKYCEIYQVPGMEMEITIFIRKFLLMDSEDLQQLFKLKELLEKEKEDESKANHIAIQESFKKLKETLQCGTSNDKEFNDIINKNFWELI